MSFLRIKTKLSSVLGLFAISLTSVIASAAPLDLATVPLSASPTVVIQPNLLFVMDDSGSMGLDYMPDWANSNDTFEIDFSFNSLSYNPSTRYEPPVNFNGSGLDTAKYPSQVGLSPETGRAFGTLRNWRAVKSNPFLSNTTTNLEALNGSNGPIFWVTLPFEYCKKPDLKECNLQSAPSADFTFPSSLRWCNSAAAADSNLVINPAAGSCQATRVGNFDNLRKPPNVVVSTTPVATITFTSASNTPRVDNIIVNGTRIMSGRTSPTNSLTTTATRTANNINACRGILSFLTQCQSNDYTAVADGNTVSIFSNDPNITATPIVQTSSGTLNFLVTPFTLPPPSPGGRFEVNINPANNSYPYPGSLIKAGSRTDCAGAVCTYEEEMTNYANWFAYYRTRAQMMKTSTSIAFRNIGEDFRVGFMGTSTLASRSLNIDRFTNSQKANWYAKLFSTPSDRNTPLRGSLSTAGRIYANKSDGKGVFTDPIQYECQQNFTLLTTDGFWNTADETNTYAGGPKQLDGASNVGNLDSNADATPNGKREGVPARSNTLADVAKYYRDTDLRTQELDNCGDSGFPGVCQTEANAGSANKKQSMVTLTLGLGVDGFLSYTSDYKTAEDGDYRELLNGTKNWSDPNPTANNANDLRDAAPARIDDLWHAAVNGDGTYFSAKKPSELITQLEQALASIQIKVGTGAAAATSTLNPISGDNFAYVASFTTGFWIGNLEKRSISTTTGEISTSPLACVEDVISESSCLSPSVVQSDGVGGYDCVTTGVTDPNACAGTLTGTDCKVKIDASCSGEMSSLVSQLTDSRTIYMNSGGSLGEFTYNNLSGFQRSYFDGPFLSSRLTQWSLLTADQRANVTGDNLVNYLRGQKAFEERSQIFENRIFRSREATLGDLVDSKPVFVGAPVFSYLDSGYEDFKANQTARAKTVFVGANDGMLHAFDADNLKERWAYVPSIVIPNLWKLADFNYSKDHIYYVNGNIVVSDICVAANCTNATSADWRTILVGGLGAGGRGFYALDVTDPLTPKLLWEVTPNTNGFENLGFSYGNPIITKRQSDGKWVVYFTSGYNNISDASAFYSNPATNFSPATIYGSGNGTGYLYVVDAANGNLLSSISTGEGNAANPSGLSKIKGFTVDSEINNVTNEVYGGDLLGNLWRFNIQDSTAFKLAKLRTNQGVNNEQPITTSPEIGIIDQKRVLFVGTGKYLELSDLSTDRLNTLYAIKDDNRATTINNPKSLFIEQTVGVDPVNADSRISTSNQPVNFSVDDGWYVDFPDSGERQNVDSQLVLGTLLVPTTVANSTACQPAGYGWFNYFNYRNGTAVNNLNGSAVSTRTQAPSVGFNVVYVDGKPKVSNVVADDKNPQLVGDVPFKGTGIGFQMKRSIWRQIIR